MPRKPKRKPNPPQPLIEKRPVGRPKADVDPAVLENLAGIGCTTPEIALITGVSEDTIERNFAGILQKGRSNFKMSLRHKQAQLALAGDKTMLIWLGKQHLGQTDKQEIRQTNAIKTYGPDAVERIRNALREIADQETAALPPPANGSSDDN